MTTTNLLAITCLLLPTISFAEVIHMKNGDLYRARILKQDFGTYVQILLKDGSEKRLPWADISSIEQAPETTISDEQIPAPNVPKAPQRSQLEQAAASDQYPTEMLDTSKPVRFELDLVGFSYDSSWQKVSLQTSASTSSVNANATNHYLRTAPVEFTLRTYLDRWHIYFDFLNAPINSGDVNDGSFSSLAVAYSLSRVFDLGIGTDFSYASDSTTGASSTTSSIEGSDYVVGPFFRVAAPLSDFVALEASATVGLDFRNLTDTTSTWSLSGSDAAFFASLRIGTSVSLLKQISYLFWVDGWMDLGTLSGNYNTAGQTVPGTLGYDIYRVRVVPAGLRIKF